MDIMGLGLEPFTHRDPSALWDLGGSGKYLRERIPTGQEILTIDVSRDATHSNTLSFRSCTDTEGVRDAAHSNPDHIENALIDTGYGGLHVNMTTASRYSSTSPVCDFRRYEPFCAGMIREVWYTSVHRASVGWMLRPY